MEVDQATLIRHGETIIGPTHLSSSDRTQYVQVDESRLIVQYVGKGLNPHDVGVNFDSLDCFLRNFYAIRANAALQNDVDVAYFEATIEKMESGTTLAIGLVNHKFVLDELPGSQPQSIGYFSNGQLHVSGRRQPTALPVLQTGSVVGMGLDYVSQQLFLTVDGTVVRTEDNLSGIFFACIGLHHSSHRVRVNFGSTPFKFDLAAKREQVRAPQIAQIAKTSIPSYSRIVYNYLLFHGYKKSAEAFVASSHIDLDLLTERDKLMLATLDERAKMRDFFANAQYAVCKEELLRKYGSTAASSEAVFLIDCLIFIDHIKHKRTKEAINFMQAVFPKWWNELTFERLEDCVSLLAYYNPATSPFAHLLSPEHAMQTLKFVNRSILFWTGAIAPQYDENDQNHEPDLVKLFSHLETLHQRLRDERGAGPILSLDMLTS